MYPFAERKKTKNKTNNMSLEITGKLILKLPMQSGISASTGKPWQKQQFVIETVEQYPRKICSMLWGDKTDQLNQFNIGDMMKISFDVESREYQGKWYTDVKTWKIEHATEAMPGIPEPMTYTSAGTPPHTSYTPPAAEPMGAPADFMAAEDTFTDDGMTDDLPF